MYILFGYSIYFVSDLKCVFNYIYYFLWKFPKSKNVLHVSQIQIHYLLKIPAEAEDLGQVRDLQQTQACSCLANAFLLCASSPLPDDGCICDWTFMHSQSHTCYFHIKAVRKELCWYPPRTQSLQSSIAVKSSGDADSPKQERTGIVWGGEEDTTISNKSVLCSLWEQGWEEWKVN